MERSELKSIHFLYHDEERQPGGYQGKKLIGVYSTAERAQEAIGRLRNMEGFRDYPERWRILELPMDEDDWSKGFDKYSHQKIE